MKYTYRINDTINDNAASLLSSEEINEFYDRFEWIDSNLKRLGVRYQVLSVVDINDEVIACVLYFLVTNPDFDKWHNITQFFVDTDDFKWEHKKDNDYFFSEMKNAFLPYVICSNPFGYKSGVIFSNTIATQERLEILEEIVVLSEEHFATEGFNLISYIWVKENNIEDKIILNEKGYDEVFVGADNNIFLNDLICFEDYLLSFNKKRRDEVKREINRFNASGNRILVVSGLNEINGIVKDISKIHEHINIKYKVGLDGDKFEGYLNAIIAKNIKNVIFLVLNKRQEIVGFNCSFYYKETLYVKHVAFLDNDSYNYFNACIYEPIKYCIANGIVKINLGGGSHRAKILRGSQPISYTFNSKLINSDLLPEYSLYLKHALRYSLEKIKAYKVL